MAKVTAINHKENLMTSLNNGTHTFIVDEPESLGGTNLGPTPNDLLAGSLAACTAITLRMYINHKKLSIEDVHVEVGVEADKTNKSTSFIRKIWIYGDYDEAVGKRLISVANACPIHKMLEGSIHITSELNRPL